MAAPGGVVLNEHVLGGVSDDVLPVVAHNDGDGSIVVLGNGLRLEEGLELVSLKIVNELADALDAEFAELSLVSVLLEVVTEADDTDRWLGSGVNSDIVSKLALNSIGGGGLNEEKLALELVGRVFEHLLVVLAALVREQDDGGGLLAEDGLNAVLVEVDKAGSDLRLDEVGQGSLGGLARVGEESLVEVAEDNDAGFGQTVVSSNSITSVVELEDIGDGRVLGDSFVDSKELIFLGSDIDDCLLDVKLLDGKLLAGELG